MTVVTEMFSKTHLSVRQGASQDTTSDIQLYDTYVSRLEAYLPLKESRWPILIGKYVSETHFQTFSKTYPHDSNLPCLFPAIAEYRSGAQTLFPRRVVYRPNDDFPQDAKM